MTHKEAVVAKLLRALETPIPGTPRLLMPLKSTAALEASETARRQWMLKNVNGNIERALKGLGVDRAYQKLEPVLGNTLEAPARRETYGARQVHDMAYQPIKSLLGALPLPIPYGLHNKVFQGVRDTAMSRLGIPKAPSFDSLHAQRMAPAPAAAPLSTPVPLSAEPTYLKTPPPKIAAAYVDGCKAALDKFALPLV